MYPFLKYKPHSRRGLPAFTLVELLTVIAIIGILAALMFPIIRVARVSAYTASDLARLRGIGAGMALFAADNNNRYPSKGLSSVPNQRETRWMSHIGRYMNIGKDVTITTTGTDNVDVSYQVLYNAYRRPEFHSAFTPPELYDWDNAILESQGIYGINTNIATNNSDPSGRCGIYIADVMLPSKTILVAERYAGVLGDITSGSPTPAANLTLTGFFPTQNNGMASNAEIMRRGARIDKGPCSVLMADFSVMQVNLEDLDVGNMNSKSTKGIRFQPTVQ